MRKNKTLSYFSKLIENIPELTTKEREILYKRLHSKTLTKIGKKLQVSEARIRQIEFDAITKMRFKWHQLKLFPK